MRCATLYDDSNIRTHTLTSCNNLSEFLSRIIYLWGRSRFLDTLGVLVTVVPLRHVVAIELRFVGDQWVGLERPAPRVGNPTHVRANIILGTRSPIGTTVRGYNRKCSTRRNTGKQRSGDATQIDINNSNCSIIQSRANAFGFDR